MFLDGKSHTLPENSEGEEQKLVGHREFGCFGSGVRKCLRVPFLYFACEMSGQDVSAVQRKQGLKGSQALRKQKVKFSLSHQVP